MPPTLAELQHPDRISQLHRDIEVDRNTWLRHSPDAANVVRFRDYALGKHKRTITDDARKVLEGVLDNDFCNNVCHKILSENAARIRLLRWDCEEKAVKEWLSDFFIKAGLAWVSSDVHYDTLRDGNHALSLSWNNEQARVTLQQEEWWDGTQGVWIQYDAYNQPLLAVKEWHALVDGVVTWRRIVWFEDRLERYSSGDKLTWVPFQLQADETWPVAWLKADGNPLHIPILHASNAGRGKQAYGLSELAGGVLGFQDQINDLEYDESAAARMTGFQMLAGSGVDLSDVQVGPGVTISIPDPQGRAYVLPAGDLSQLIAVKADKLKSVSQMTRTPLHAISGGDWPSGEALLRAEQPLVAKAEVQIDRFASLWATVAHRATEIANVYGRAGLDETAMVTASFASPERRDALSLSTIAGTIAPFTSEEDVLRVLGRTPDQIEQIMQEKRAAQALQPQQQATDPFTATRQAMRMQLSQRATMPIAAKVRSNGA